MPDLHHKLLMDVLQIAEVFLRHPHHNLCALEQFPVFDPRSEPLLHRIYHAINHYVVDEDLHKKDQDYEQYQLKIIFELCEDLKNQIASTPRK